MCPQPVLNHKIPGIENVTKVAKLIITGKIILGHSITFTLVVEYSNHQHVEEATISSYADATTQTVSEVSIRNEEADLSTYAVGRCGEPWRLKPKVVPTGEVLFRKGRYKGIPWDMNIRTAH